LVGLRVIGVARILIALEGTALDDNGLSGLDKLMDHANAALAEMVSARELTDDERSRMTLAAFPWRSRDLLAPFARDGVFRGLASSNARCQSFPIRHGSTMSAMATRKSWRPI